MVNGEITTIARFGRRWPRARIPHAIRLRGHSPSLSRPRDVGLFEPAGEFSRWLCSIERSGGCFGPRPCRRQTALLLRVGRPQASGVRVELEALFAHGAVPRAFRLAVRLHRLARAGHRSTRADVRLPWHRAASPQRACLDGVVDRRYLADSGSIGTCRSGKGARRSSPASHHIDRYRDLLADSVSLQLMSDVPYGVFERWNRLRGGDGARGCTARPFPTFSVLSRGTVGSGDAEAARDVAVSAGVPNHQLLFRRAKHWSDAGRLAQDSLELRNVYG